MVGALIHSGAAVTRIGVEYGVPKRDLVATLQLLLQSGRLQFAAEMPKLDVLKEELRNFHVKINPETAHEGYSAWREGDHDDMVLSVSLAAWWGEYLKPARAASR